MNLPIGPVETTQVANRLPLTLHLYYLLTAMAVPAANLLLRYRLKRGKEHAGWGRGGDPLVFNGQH